MKGSELRKRSKEFAVRIIGICDGMEKRSSTEILSKQVIRSATSIGANIHEANYAASKADFINKLKIALKECFETEYWLEMLEATGKIPEAAYRELFLECGIIRKMLVKSINTASQ